MNHFLSRHLGFQLIAILFPSNPEELNNLLEVRHLMHNTRIILVLPDEQVRTISDGHLLRPRFITTAGGNLNDVAAVAQKMAASAVRY
jgi:hypothetical protein